MNFSRNGLCKALQFDGDNHFEIMGMFQEHGRSYKKNWDEGTMRLNCFNNEVELFVNGAKIKKGFWVIVDENGWLYAKNKKMFKIMFSLEADMPITRTIKKTITKKAKKAKKTKTIKRA